MKLDQKFPTAVKVRDKMGNLVIVQVEYPHIPHKCQGCQEFGHLLLRCPKIIVPEVTSDSSSHFVPASLPSQICVDALEPQPHKDTHAQSKDHVKFATAVSDPPEREKSLPSRTYSDHDSSTSGWAYVARRSKPRNIPPSESSSQRKVTSLTLSQFKEEENVIIEAQKRLHLHSVSVPVSPHVVSIPSSKKKRKKVRQQPLIEAENSVVEIPSVSTTISL